MFILVLGCQEEQAASLQQETWVFCFVLFCFVLNNKNPETAIGVKLKMREAEREATRERGFTSTNDQTKGAILQTA